MTMLVRRGMDRLGAAVNALLRPTGVRLVRRPVYEAERTTLGNVVQCRVADETLVEHLRQFRPHPSVEQAADVAALVYSPAWNLTYQHQLSPLRHFLPGARLREGYRFLDVGAAVGQLGNQLSRLNFTGHYVGIDVGGAFLSIAHRQCPPTNANRSPHFIQADAACLPFDTGTFDVVFSRSTLVAQQDWKRALQEMLRVSVKWLILLETPFHEQKDETVYFMQCSKNHTALLCAFTQDAFVRQLPQTANVQITPGEESEIANFGRFRWHNIVIELR